VDEPGFGRLIEAFTRPGLVPLAPEIEMHLATELTPLWQATENLVGMGDVPPPYWAFAWPGGQAIARHVLDHPDLVRGTRVLDLACGGGLQAIAAAMAGAAEVTANDIDPIALTATRRNAARNGVEVATLADDLVGTTAATRRWDVILAGDVCYQQDMANAVLDWLRAAARSGTHVILADCGRAYAPTRGVDELASYDVPVDLAVEDADHKLTRVWRLQLR
jgi:predicted nicotinamide N-methyase